MVVLNNNWPQKPKGETMAIKASIKALCALCASAILFVGSQALAQAPTAYKPGDLLTFTVRFDGDGIDKLNNANVHLDLMSPVHEDQKAFVKYLNVSSGNPTRPGVFDVSLKIPDFIASGTYTVRSVSTGTAYVNFTYNDDLPVITITVENNEHFTQPSLKSVEKTSHP
jgi:hypothetical protein